MNNNYSKIAKDVEKRFYALSYELDRSLLKQKNKIIIGLMEDELREITMTEFAALWSWLINRRQQWKKKVKGTKKENLNLKIIKTA